MAPSPEVSDMWKLSCVMSSTGPVGDALALADGATVAEGVGAVDAVAADGDGVGVGDDDPREMLQPASDAVAAAMAHITPMRQPAMITRREYSRVPAAASMQSS